jgi:hypothetical protein
MTDDSLEKLMALYCAYCLGTGMMELVMRDQSREPWPCMYCEAAGASATSVTPQKTGPPPGRQRSGNRFLRPAGRVPNCTAVCTGRRAWSLPRVLRGGRVPGQC